MVKKNEAYKVKLLNKNNIVIALTVLLTRPCEARLDVFKLVTLIEYFYSRAPARRDRNILYPYKNIAYTLHKGRTIFVLFQLKSLK